MFPQLPCRVKVRVLLHLARSLSETLGYIGVFAPGGGLLPLPLRAQRVVQGWRKPALLTRRGPFPETAGKLGPFVTIVRLSTDELTRSKPFMHFRVWTR